MSPTTIRFGAVLAGSVLVLASLSATADEKGKPALAGVWVLHGGELKIEFCDKNVLKITPHGDKEVLLITCDYKIDKDNRVAAKITDVEGTAKEKAQGVVPVGLEFSFTWQVKDNVATLGDVKGKNVDPVKAHLEGEYDQKK